MVRVDRKWWKGLLLAGFTLLGALLGDLAPAAEPPLDGPSRQGEAR